MKRRRRGRPLSCRRRPPAACGAELRYGSLSPFREYEDIQYKKYLRIYRFGPQKILRRKVNLSTYSVFSYSAKVPPIFHRQARPPATRQSPPLRTPHSPVAFRIPALSSFRSRRQRRIFRRMVGGGREGTPAGPGGPLAQISNPRPTVGNMIIVSKLGGQRLIIRSHEKESCDRE